MWNNYHYKKSGNWVFSTLKLNSHKLINQHEDINLKTRSLITVVALMAQGLTDNSLKFHIMNAKAHGVTQLEDRILNSQNALWGKVILIRLALRPSLPSFTSFSVILFMFSLPFRRDATSCSWSRKARRFCRYANKDILQCKQRFTTRKRGKLPWPFSADYIRHDTFNTRDI